MATASQVRALSEELENPMNVHRWRKLEGSDPAMYELIQKARTRDWMTREPDLFLETIMIYMDLYRFVQSIIVSK